MKCNLDECNKKTATIVGHCKFCNNFYCLNHRLVESHLCSNMQSCRIQALNKNTNSLLKNKCVSTKINSI